MTHDPAIYEIVNKIIIQDGAVYISGAVSNVRPLSFVKREEPELTAVFQRRGLRALLAVVLREVYYGRWRLRSGSRITRALRESIHAMTLEEIHRCGEKTVVEKLAAVAEELLTFPDREPSPEDGIREPVLNVRLFGAFTLENERGCLTESTGRRTVVWLLLKYLLVTGKGEADLPELLERGVWPHGADNENAARVRLNRLREALQPLGLDGKTGLVLFHGGRYSINPRIAVKTDAAAFSELLGEIRKRPVDDPSGPELCREALQLVRGPFLGNGAEAPWAAPYREIYHREVVCLAHTMLERMRLLEPNGSIESLCRVAAEIAPGDKALNMALLSHLAEQGRELERTDHLARLSCTEK